MTPASFIFVVIDNQLSFSFYTIRKLILLLNKSNRNISNFLLILIVFFFPPFLL